MPTAPFPNEFEIVPLFEIVLFEFSKTAGPVWETSTDPPDVIVMLPAVPPLAASVCTGDVSLPLIVRSLANAGAASSMQTAAHAI